MKRLIVGLGNPGEQYENTRHNVGKVVVAKIASTENLDWNNLGYGVEAKWGENFLFIPSTFMNNSGIAVLKFMKLRDLSPLETVLVRDDLDMELGKVKGIVWKSRSGGHNGVESIITELATNDFGQLKIGIGRPYAKDQIVDFVTEGFSKDEKKIIDLAIEEAVSRITVWVNNEGSTNASQ